MASIHRDPKSKVFRVMFRYGGKQYQKSLKTTQPAEAEALKGRIDLCIMELERGRRTLPPGADLWQFLLSDGQRSQKVEPPAAVTIDQLFARYEQEMPPGTLEENTLETARLHKKHLLRILGGRTVLDSVTTSEMQKYVNTRAKEKYRGRTIAPLTIRKEIATFRAVWNWGKLHGVVKTDAPTKGLKYEKQSQKLGFMTWDEIERRVGRGVSGADAAALWNALFLNGTQLAECLEYVKTTANAAFVYPMFVFVAHTGARRSEMMRSRVEDIDFEAKKVTIRERKKDRSVKETTRLVEMSPLLERVMREWLTERHPGGPFTFAPGDVVGRSRKRSRTTGHQSGPGRSTTTAGRRATVRERTEKVEQTSLTRNEATHYFKRTLAGSKWAVVRGFHVFRHSFASNLAAKGVSRDAINEFMGHQTEEMRRRYRHLFPEEKTDAIPT